MKGADLTALDSVLTGAGRDNAHQSAQMTAGLWMRIGPLSISQGPYETFAEAMSPHDDGDLADTWILTGGQGGPGGLGGRIPPLAICAKSCDLCAHEYWHRIHPTTNSTGRPV